MKEKSMKWTWPKIWEGDKGGWWRVMVTFLLWWIGMILGILVITAVMLALKDILKNQPLYVKDSVRYLIGGPAQHGLMLLGCLLGVRYLHHKPISSVFTDGRQFRIGLAFQSAVVWIILWFIGAVLHPNGWQQLVQRAGEIPVVWWLILTLVTFFAVAIQSTDEEVVFRGYLLTRLAAWVKHSWLAVCIMAVIFTAIHFQTSIAATVTIFIFSLIIGIACIRAGTLSPLIGMHTANNAMQGLWSPKSTNSNVVWLDAVLFILQLVIWYGWFIYATQQKPSSFNNQSVQL